MVTELQLDLDSEWPEVAMESIPEPEKVDASIPEAPPTLRRVYEDEEWRELMEVDEW